MEMFNGPVGSDLSKYGPGRIKAFKINIGLKWAGFSKPGLTQLGPL